MGLELIALAVIAAGLGTGIGLQQSAKTSAKKSKKKAEIRLLRSQEGADESVSGRASTNLTGGVLSQRKQPTGSAVTLGGGG